MTALDPSKLVFIDESGFDTKMTWRCGRAARGAPCVGIVPHGHWRNNTFIAGLRCDRIDAPMLIEGAMDGDAFTAWVEQMLVPTLFKHDLQLRRRNRRTAKKLYEQIVTEGYTGSYSPVQRFVRELRQTSGTGTDDAFIPLHFAAGDALQFDWSEEYVLLGGVEHKVHVAHFRLCHSRKPFVVAYLNESEPLIAIGSRAMANEMVLDAFIRALAFFGGVPRRGEHRSTKGGKTSGRRFEM